MKPKSAFFTPHFCKHTGFIFILLIFLFIPVNKLFALDVSISGPSKVLVNESASFSVSYTCDAEVTAVSWKFGDGGSSSGSTSTSHAYKKTGDLTVSVSVTVSSTDKEGKKHTETGSDTRSITVNAKLSLSADPDTLPCDGESTTILTMKVLDYNGDTVSSYNKNLSLSSSNANALKVSETAKVKNGKAVAKGTSGKESAKVTVKANGVYVKEGICEIEVNVEFNLTAKDTQADSNRIGNPLNMVKRSYNRKATIETQLAKGEFPEDYPQWFGKGIVAKDGDTEANWSGNESVVVTAKVYDIMETADIVLHEEDESNNNISLADEIGKIKRNLGIWIKLLELTTGSMDVDGSYLLKRRLVDVYDSPEVGYNLILRGNGSVSSSTCTGNWTLKFKLLKMIPITYNAEVTGKNIEISLLIENYMKDLTVPEADRYSGYAEVNAGGGITFSNSKTIEINKFGVKELKIIRGGGVKCGGDGSLKATTGDIDINIGLLKAYVTFGGELVLENDNSYPLTITAPIPLIKKALSYDFTVNIKSFLE